jgi:alpha-N-arabinofuranosidase
VNPQAEVEKLKIEINGISSLKSKGKAITLAGKPDDTNSLSQPKKVLPKTKTLHRIKPGFNYEMPANSIVVLKLKAST